MGGLTDLLRVRNGCKSVTNCADMTKKEVTIEGQNIKTIYVHELQRALRVCGLWDFAKNFKV